MGGESIEGKLVKQGWELYATIDYMWPEDNALVRYVRRNNLPHKIDDFDREKRPGNQCCYALYLKFEDVKKAKSADIQPDICDIPVIWG